MHTVREYPPASLLVRPPIADWPTAATNGELLELARTWRRQALECGRDQAAIEDWVKQGREADAARNFGAVEFR